MEQGDQQFFDMQSMMAQMHNIAELLLGAQWNNTDAIRNRKYGTVKKLLREGEDPNRPMNMSIPIFDMTPLEYAVYDVDWKMFLVLFVNGATPKKNWFDGVIQTHASSHGVGEPIQFEAFRRDDGEFQAIDGFDGLETILEHAVDVDEEYVPDKNKTMSCVWLARALSEQSMTADVLGAIRDHLAVIDPELDWTEEVSRKLEATNDIWDRRLPEDVIKNLEELVLCTLLSDVVQGVFDRIVSGLDDDSGPNSVLSTQPSSGPTRAPSAMPSLKPSSQPSNTEGDNRNEDIKQTENQWITVQYHERRKT